MSGELSERAEKPLKVEGAADPGPGFAASLSMIVMCFEVKSVNFWTLSFLIYKYRGNTYSL